MWGSVCLWCIALRSFAVTAGGVVVQLPEKAAVVGPQISLGEIADILGGDKAVIERIRHLMLGRAAPAGEKVRMTLGYIRVALRRDGYSLDGFSFGGAETVEILTQSQSFDPSDLLPKVKTFILRETGELPENVDVKMEGAGKKIILPAGAMTVKFRPSFSGKYEGPTFLTAELEVDGRLIRVLPMRIEVEIYHPAVTSCKRIEKGEKFTKENVALTRAPSSKIINGCFQQLNYVLGRTASMPLIPGTVIRVNDIYDPPTIRHGQIVQGIIEKGNIELTVQVTAIADGKAGDFILVENTESHKVLHCKILDEKTVLIEQDDIRQKTGVVK